MTYTFFLRFRSLSVGYKNAYTLYSLNSVDQQLEEIYSSHGDDICIVERLFSSSLLAIVSLNAPRKLKVCHFKKGTEICNYSYSNTIKTVKLNRARLVVCLEESLYIHNIRDMKVVHTIRDTPINSAGLCALAADSDNCYLAYPGSAVTGELQIFDAVNLHAKTMIPAHDSPLAAMAFSLNGSEIATASEKGTVIRVFSVRFVIGFVITCELTRSYFRSTMERNSSNSGAASSDACRSPRCHSPHASNTYAAAATPKPCTSSSWNGREWAESGRRTSTPVRSRTTTGWATWRARLRTICHTLCQHRSPMSSRRGELLLRRCCRWRGSSMLAQLQLSKSRWGECGDYVGFREFE